MGSLMAMMGGAGMGGMGGLGIPPVANPEEAFAQQLTQLQVSLTPAFSRPLPPAI